MNTGIAVKGIIERNGKYLLVKRHYKDTEKPGQWEIPGGRLNQGENPVVGLKREILEETNLTVDVIQVVNVDHFTRKDGQIITMIIYYCKTNDSEVKISYEHDDFKWLTFEEVKETIIDVFLKDIKILERMKSSNFFNN